MTRGPARATLSLVLALPPCATLWSVGRIARDPLLRPVIELQGQALAAALDRATARAATPDAIHARLTALLGEAPRNWRAIEAVEQVAADRGIALPAALAGRRAALRAGDDSLTSRATRCGACILDPAAIPASGGSSAPVKAGAGALRVAWRMGLVSPRLAATLAATLADAASSGIRSGALTA